MLYSLSLLVLADASQICEEHACRHALVKRFAPVYRLDKNFKCFPGAPALVYEARKANESEVICEDAGKLHEVPIFYHYEQCNEEVVVVDYWLWYSHQGPCMTILGKDYGAHAGDWERIAVHIKNDRVKAVRFHQHSGSYTKHRSEIDFVDEHPVSYSGQDSHGNYHDQGGTGNCLYFQDFRRWDDKTLKVVAWFDVLNHFGAKEAWKNPLWSIKNGSHWRQKHALYYALLLFCLPKL